MNGFTKQHSSQSSGGINHKTKSWLKGVVIVFLHAPQCMVVCEHAKQHVKVAVH